MPVLGPDFIALQVRDLQASATFYTENLGLHPAPVSPPGAVVFATEPIPFAIREPAVDLDATDRLGWGVALWLKADNPQAIHDHLLATGVQIVTPPRMARSGAPSRLPTPTDTPSPSTAE